MNKWPAINRWTHLCLSAAADPSSRAAATGDFNVDGRLDQRIAGHQGKQGRAPTVYLDPADGNVISASPTVLPAVPREGMVLFHDNHICMPRTPDSDSAFDASTVVQKVNYLGLQSRVIFDSNRLVCNPLGWGVWVLWMLVGQGQLVGTSGLFSSFSVTP
jgi:hypothetical protein